jgi:hypothetical protein
VDDERVDLTGVGPTRREKGRLPIFGIIKNSPLTPTTPTINKLKLPSAPGMKWVGHPKNTVLHPLHQVQFATHAKLKVDDCYHNGAAPSAETPRKRRQGVVAGLQSGQPLFQSVNSVGTAVTGRALNRYNAWAAIRKRAKAAVFSRPSDVTPGGRLASRFTWRMTDGSSTPSRWRDMSLREQ